MSFDTYDIFFSGQMISGQDPARVKRHIGKIFKLEGEKLDRLFTGKPIPVKRGVDMDTAVKYRVAFREAGALVDIQPAQKPAGEAPPATPHRTPAPTATATKQQAAESESGMTLAPANSGSLEAFALQGEAAPPPDTSHLQLGAVGSIIDETEAAPPVEIDTHELSLAPAQQGNLDEFNEIVVPPVLPDISHLQIEEPEKKEQEE
ncbi:hypothetical protein [endosymbiont of Ridgeia piscesae]|jgi:hypothetical protein|uniref:Uncharacterized protein n=1 Tax=endosymbiont of Ridgeia piscesae TaxID=54398 RepID=A0A0T5Z3W7_9GAMM|nr:hypothetical protein [endosymbiont of Ridgeia piscesae]KRT54877.1 hypothetical protein Ga0074115_11092 [endosymbiont of Ridgeia piscesae]KRT57536.1 hypothetical protein Ga0076813_11707 [endosymbiont of Ridgeia piscesae]